MDWFTQSLLLGIVITLAMRLMIRLVEPISSSTRYVLWTCTLVTVAILPLAGNQFTVPGARLSLVQLRLSPTARDVLARVRRILVHATIVTRDGQGVQHTVRRILSLREVNPPHRRGG